MSRDAALWSISSTPGQNGVGDPEDQQGEEGAGEDDDRLRRPDSLVALRCTVVVQGNRIANNAKPASNPAMAEYHPAAAAMSKVDPASRHPALGKVTNAREFRRTTGHGAPQRCPSVPATVGVRRQL